jgi:protein maelstrom
MLATAMGLLPTQVINVYLGSTLRSMRDVLTDDNTATTGYIVFCIQVILNWEIAFKFMCTSVVLLFKIRWLSALD